MSRYLGLVVVSFAALACRTSPGGGAAEPGRSATLAVDLAAYVPADTAFAMFLERGLFDHPFADTMNEAMRSGMVEGLEEDDGEPPGNDGPDLFFREIGVALGHFEAPRLAAAGWVAGKSEMALYTVGLIPVLRIEGDGPKLEALIRRGAKAAGVAVVAKKWKDRPYLAIALDDESDAQAMIAVAPNQVAVAIAGTPDAILDHITDFQPLAGPSLATHWDVPAGGRVAYIDPARLGTLLADRREVRRLIGAKEEMPPAGCMAAIAGMLTALPRTTSTVRSDATSLEWDFAFDLAADTAALFRGHPLPGWAKERDVPSLRIGVGVPPYPLMTHSGGFVSAVERVDVACADGGDAHSADELRAALAQMAPLRAIDAVTFELVALDGSEVTMSLALAVNDLPALWSMMASVVPLGSTVPAIGDVRDLSAMGMPATIAVGRGLLIGSMGGEHTARARTLLTAEPGPRVPMLARFDREFGEAMRAGRLVFMGQPMKDEDDEQAFLAVDSVMDARLEGNRLVIRTSMTEH